MLSFESDYTEGAHEKILTRLVETNLEKLSGYGNDKYCDAAKAKIKAACDCHDADIYFLAGGTQTNAVVIASMLKMCEGVVAAQTGHVNVHEAGAIEHTGHKVLTIPQHEGKIDAAELAQFMQDFYGDGNHAQMVYPGMVYISHPTEYGTLYTAKELADISEVCKKYTMPLFIDGARLGYGLMSRTTDVTLPRLAKYSDVFYIGGTKCGALCGEALVFTKNNTPKYFITMQKEMGAMLAKGRLLGIQFDVLFTDNLYMDICRHAIDMAELMKDIFKAKGCNFYLESPTNQQFITLENSKAEALSKDIKLNFWEKYDDTHTVYRFATSWATKEEDLHAMEALL